MGSFSSGGEEKEKEKDLYRETWIRYLGYANEVGESFRAIVPVSVVWASYAVATAYVTADAVDKGRKAAAADAVVGRPQEEGRARRATVAVVDTFVWQGLASVAIPGFTINRLCAASLYLLGRTTRWPLSVRKWTTTALGLSAIPFIVKPIDSGPTFCCGHIQKSQYFLQEFSKIIASGSDITFASCFNTLGLCLQYLPFEKLPSVLNSLLF